MKKSLLFIFFLIITVSLNAQKDSLLISGSLKQKTSQGENTTINISIFPVPVRENNFTIKADKDISYVRITNIIGQDIVRIRYTNPQQLVKIALDYPKRGMYLVTIIFSDGIKVVKKIMIEEQE